MKYVTIACLSCSRNYYPLVGLVIKVKEKILFYRFYDDLRFKILISQLKLEKVIKVIISEKDIMETILNDFECIPISRSYFKTNTDIIYNKKIIKPQNDENKYCNYEDDFFIFKQTLEYHFTIAAYNALDSYLKNKHCININNYKFEYRTDTLQRMIMTHQTILDLNILDTKNSVYSKIRNTKTKIGDRFLRHNLLQPLTNKFEIEERHDILRFMSNNANFIKDIGAYLNSVIDSGQIVESLSLERGNTLYDYKNSIMNCLKIKKFMKNISDFIEIFKNFFNFEKLEIKKLEIKNLQKENLENENLEKENFECSRNNQKNSLDKSSITISEKNISMMNSLIFQKNNSSFKNHFYYQVNKDSKLINIENVDIKQTLSDQNILNDKINTPTNSLKNKRSEQNNVNEKQIIPEYLHKRLLTVLKYDFNNVKLNINTNNIGINEIIYGVEFDDEFLALTRKIYEEHLQDLLMIKECFLNDKGIKIELSYDNTKGYLFKCKYEDIFKNTSKIESISGQFINEKITINSKKSNSINNSINYSMKKNSMNNNSINNFSDHSFFDNSMNNNPRIKNQSMNDSINKDGPIKFLNSPFSAFTDDINYDKDSFNFIHNKKRNKYSKPDSETDNETYKYSINDGYAIDDCDINKQTYNHQNNNQPFSDHNLNNDNLNNDNFNNDNLNNETFNNDNFNNNFKNHNFEKPNSTIFDEPDLNPIILFKRKEQIFFTTIETQKINNRINNCIDEIINICGEICVENEKKFVKYRQNFLEISEIIAEFDMIHSFYLFTTKNKCKIPTFGDTIAISDTSHLFLQKNSVKNSIYADEDLKTQFVTGGNMCGKTTYVKQIGILIVLGQIGSPINGNGILRIFKRLISRLVRNLNENEFEEINYFLHLIDSKNSENKINKDENGNDLNYTVNNLNYKVKNLNYKVNNLNYNGNDLNYNGNDLNHDTLIIIDELGRSMFYKEGLSFLLAFTMMLIKKNVFSYIVTHYTEVLNYLEDDKINVIKAENYCLTSGVGKSDCAIELCKEYFPVKVIEDAVKLKMKYLGLDEKQNSLFDNSYVRLAIKLKKDKCVDINRYLKKKKNSEK
ncbi:MutS like protein 4 [Dictyocoela muelleri]|nr:MutS like protein 4 [Dictyocoela muelleri]